jgi:tetratricopeptide (TPR) repeat protein
LKKKLLIFICISFQTIAFAQLNTERILAIGQNALYFEDYVLSIQYFNQVIKIKPYLTEPYVLRAIAKIQLGDYVSADQDCTEALKLNPFLPQAYYARGFARRKLEFLPEAITDFTKALEFSPNNSFYLMNRVDAREQNKDYAGALADLEQYKKLNPKKNAVLFEQGRILLSMKDTVNAENCFNKYLSADSISASGWSARAYMRMLKKDYEGALSDYNQAIARKSNNIGDYINRGILLMDNKKYNQAIADYNEAIKIDKKNPTAYFNRGILRSSLGDNNNALKDFEQVLAFDSTNIEARLRKAMLQSTLGDKRGAIKEFHFIIDKHPNYLPAYYCLAEAYEGIGNAKEAFRYRFTASKLDANKDNIKKDKKALSNSQIASTAPKAKTSNVALFNRFAAQNLEDNETESKYEQATRGTVQDKYTDVINEKNFALTFYAKVDEIRRTNLFYQPLEQYNKLKKLGSNLKITNNEIPLTSELISTHFDAINTLSAKLSAASDDADLYFYRAIEFSLVQDFKSSLEDLNKVLELRPDFMLAYFFRANIRYKLLEYSKNAVEQLENTNKGEKANIATKIAMDNEIILHDYEKATEMAPDFSFAYFNKGNMNCSLKNFTQAISNYTKAIEIDNDFAEAYFNRGLTYLFTGEDSKGLNDLSKAGELGIYRSYNLIQRFKK